MYHTNVRSSSCRAESSSQDPPSASTKVAASRSYFGSHRRAQGVIGQRCRLGRSKADSTLPLPRWWGNVIQSLRHPSSTGRRRHVGPHRRHDRLLQPGGQAGLGVDLCCGFPRVDHVLEGTEAAQRSRSPQHAQQFAHELAPNLRRKECHPGNSSSNPPPSPQQRPLDPARGAARGPGRRLRAGRLVPGAAGVGRRPPCRRDAPGRTRRQGAFCVAGAGLDAVVDLGVGSPTFDEWDAVVLDETDRRAVRLGHVFLALSEGATLRYLCSDVFKPSREDGVNPLDPAIGMVFAQNLAAVVSAAKHRQGIWHLARCRPWRLRPPVRGRRGRRR